MNKSSILDVLKRQYVIVLTVVAVGVVLCLLALTRYVKYTATSTILTTSARHAETGSLDPNGDPSSSAIAPADIPDFLQSKTLLDRVGSDLHLTKKERARLGGEIKAKVSMTSDDMPITVTDQDPKLAVSMVNDLVHQLQVFEAQVSASRYDMLVADLQKQLGARRNILRNLDDRIAVLSARDPYISPENGTSDINKRLIALVQQRDTLRATMLGDASAATIAERRPGLARQLASREITSGDPVFQNLGSQYGKDLAQLNLTKAGYTARFPGLAGLQAQVQSEGRDIADRTKRETAQPLKSPAYVAAMLEANKAQSLYASDRAQLAALDSQIDGTTAHLNGSRGESAVIAALRRDRSAGDSAYAALSDRLAKSLADRAQAASINSVVPIDSPSAASRALLSRPTVIVPAFAIAFVWLAITLAFIADGADSRLRDRATIEDLYGSPVLTYVG